MVQCQAFSAAAETTLSEQPGSFTPLRWFPTVRLHAGKVLGVSRGLRCGERLLWNIGVCCRQKGNLQHRQGNRDRSTNPWFLRFIRRQLLWSETEVHLRGVAIVRDESLQESAGS
ncbi:hypothetical protein FGB62_394g03 [Gracilaria domingensis]|nr:hypothetical protein FGB62_394g03 [Gracilaria domingensis]